ncbi:hypothetical protein OG953_06365 [Streptomyces sp. NBC_00057]
MIGPVADDHSVFRPPAQLVQCPLEEAGVGFGIADEGVEQDELDLVLDAEVAQGGEAFRRLVGNEAHLVLPGEMGECVDGTTDGLDERGPALADSLPAVRAVRQEEAGRRRAWLAVLVEVAHRLMEGVHGEVGIVRLRELPDVLEPGEIEGFVVVEDSADINGEGASRHDVTTRPEAQVNHSGLSAPSCSILRDVVGSRGPCSRAQAAVCRSPSTSAVSVQSPSVLRARLLSASTR